MKRNWKTNDIDKETGCNKRGIYRIRLVKKNGQPVEIRRLGGIDKEGILAIGRSIDIERRQKQFLRASSDKGKHGHSEGIQWWLVKYFSDFGKKFSILFDFEELKSKEDTIKNEIKEIQEYFKKYLEPPPLNGAIPKREKWFEDLLRK